MNRRQMLLGGLVPAMGALGLMAPDALAKKKGKKKPGKKKPVKKPVKKFKTITRTFANPASITIFNIAPASLYPTPIAVSGFKQGQILDVNLTLHDFSHEAPGDLDLLLVAPDGSCALIMSDAGGGPDVSNLTITLDDQAPAPMPAAGPLVSQAYQPTIIGGVKLLPAPAPGFINGGTFSVFNGRNPNGLWQLFINDAEGGSDSGSIAGGWSLTIRARVKK